MEKEENTHFKEAELKCKLFEEPQCLLRRCGKSSKKKKRVSASVPSTWPLVHQHNPVAIAPAAKSFSKCEEGSQSLDSLLAPQGTCQVRCSRSSGHYQAPAGWSVLGGVYFAAFWSYSWSSEEVHCSQQPGRDASSRHKGFIQASWRNFRSLFPTAPWLARL